QTRTLDNLINYTKAETPKPKSRYGGWEEIKTNATGYFHVKKIGDRWWGVDPDGYLYINIALNSINQRRSDRNKKALADKFGTAEQWIDSTLNLLQDFGINCAGSWSDHKAIIQNNIDSEKPFAYTINWNFM